MKNVTISITDSVEKFVRMEAAKQDKSLSRFVSDLLLNALNRKESASDWIKSFEAQESYVNSAGKKYTREEIYDRKIFR